MEFMADRFATQFEIGGFLKREKLEEFISQAYTDTAKWVRDNPFGSAGSEPDE